MADPTPAQEEFNALLSSANKSYNTIHPEDRNRSESPISQTESERFRQQEIDDVMRSQPLNATTHLPSHFSSHAATGVKGVIADAIAYEEARRGKFKTVLASARQSFINGARSRSGSKNEEDSDEETFMAAWRESRRRELEEGGVVRGRRTSPSVRVYGRWDEVDALGYLDAIEKVGRETVVIVYVYDPGCEISTEVEQALTPLVTAYPTAHFVKVHYEEVEFDAAAVPAILAYKNQGDLVANLTGLIELMPESESFTTEGLEGLLKRHDVL